MPEQVGLSLQRRIYSRIPSENGSGEIVRSNPVATIAIAQLFGTSLWFSANSAAPDLMRAWGISVSGIGLLTNAVQLGFILGTMSFALSGLADRFPASQIFAVSACSGALFNACFAFFSHGLASAAVFRFLVGICLAGIYPIGMKLVVSWEPKQTGAALAYLVGMLTLGTALPQGVRFIGAQWNWQAVILSSSGLAIAGAALIFSLGDGPHLALRSGLSQKHLAGFERIQIGKASRRGSWLLWPHVGALHILDSCSPDPWHESSRKDSTPQCSRPRVH